MKYRTRTYYTDAQKDLNVGAMEARLDAPPDWAAVQSGSIPRPKAFCRGPVAFDHRNEVAPRSP